jgi:hypothetical protein
MAVEQALLALVGAADTGGYKIKQSLRFNWADSTRLYRTFGSNNSNANFTVSLWCKRAALNEYNAFLGAQVDGPNYEHWMFYGDNTIGTSNGVGGFATDHNSTALFRDPSAWCHIVWKNIASGSTTVYVNNTQVLSFARGTKAVNGNYNHNIGVGADSLTFGANFYLAEYHLVDGSALDPTDFGEYDDNGVWRPIAYTGSYGTNGFYLKFDPSATNGIGHDHSGNGNHFTPTGFTTSGTDTDVMSDTPTTNWCTLNPLSPSQSEAVLANGNLDCTWTNVSGHTRRSTIAVGSGKWYAEITRGTSTLSVGLVDADLKLLSWPGNSTYGSTGSYAYRTDDGNKYNNGSGSSYGSTVATGDVIGIAYDGDNGALYFSKNGTWQNSGDPTSGASATGAAFTGLGNQTWTIACGNAGGSTNGTATNFNFGQRAFAYTPPTGFNALNTANLPEPDIADGSQYFNTVLYSGTGAELAVSGVGFQPDFTWLKRRNNSSHHHLFDAVRGVTKALASDDITVEETNAEFLKTFDADGFTLGTNGGLNASGSTNVAWNWLAGGTGSSNTDGDITSTVSANPTAGFSIVSYTGTLTNATVGHGLGVAPSMIICKQRTGAANEWGVYHESLGNDKFLKLNTTDSQITASTLWNSTSPTSTVFSLGTANIGNNSAPNIAYCFAEVEGYSKIGSYVGNGSADGPFVFTNFRPAWIMIKDSTGSGNSWYISDNKRNTYNVVNGRLMANLSNDESTSISICDFTSNGFKIRTSDSGWNTSSSTYIFAAFAEHPTGGSGVSPATAR